MGAGYFYVTPPPSTQRYLYTAWFRDELLDADEQDYEWPACMLIEASSPVEARAWGDQLSASFSVRRGTEKFLWSEIELATDKVQGVPLIRAGDETSDAKMGW